MDDPVKQATELAQATGKTVEEVRRFGEFADQLFGKGLSTQMLLDHLGDLIGIELWHSGSVTGGGIPMIWMPIPMLRR